MQHSFNKLLRKNLLYLAFPVVLVLSILLLLLQQVARLEVFQTTSMDDLSLVKTLYASGERNVSVTLGDLQSAGFSQTEGDKETAEYFYRKVNGKMQLVLLKTSTAQKYRKGELAGGEVRVRIGKDEVAAQHIEHAYAASLGFSQGEMTGVFSPYILDETQYPLTRIRILRIASISLSALLGLLMIYVILATAFPALNQEAWILKRYGGVARTIRRLDREMEKQLKYHQDNVTVTENYLIVSYITRIDVVRIDDIKYLSKHVERRRRGIGRQIHIYRLTASNGEDLYFEADFNEEDIVNDIIYYMRGEPLLEYEENVRREKEAEENALAEQESESEKEAVSEEKQKELEELFSSEAQSSKESEEQGD